MVCTCGVEGPPATTRQGAIEAWNNRPGVTLASDVADILEGWTMSAGLRKQLETALWGEGEN